MLTLYRRHRSTCKHRSRRYKSCSCPIWAQGVLRGEVFRRSLDLTSWEAASRKIIELEIQGEGDAVSVREVCDRWIDDCIARNLKEQGLKKYRHIAAELKAAWGDLPLRSVKIDDVRKLREGWTFSPITTRKRLEMMRGFFSFCVSSGWIQVNPTKAIRPPRVQVSPTLPFSDDQVEKLLWAVDTIREVHTQIPESTQKKLRALILLLLHSGMRISNAVLMQRDRIKNGKLLIYTQKTGTPVWCPLPKKVLDALAAADEGDPYYFWSGNGTPKSMITEWQERMKRVCAIAGIPDGHFHRLRDTFSVRLLENGVPRETVAILLGNTLQVCQKHYAPWVKSRQIKLEEAVKATW
jgi:integrase